MCTPTAAIGLLGAGLSFYQQGEQAEAATEAANIQYDIETRRAQEESQDRQNQLSQDLLEESQRVNQQRQELALQALRAQAGQRVASAESGTGGVSKVRSFLTSEIQEGQALSDIAAQQQNTAFNAAQRARGIHSAKVARSENAFLTRQANRRNRPGIIDLGIGALNADGVGEALGERIFGKPKGKK